MSKGKGGDTALFVIMLGLLVLAFFGLIEFNADQLNDLINWVTK